MYVKKKDLAAEYSISLGSVDKQMRWIRNQIDKGRYPRSAVTRTEGIVRVRLDVFEDCMTNRDAVDNGLDVPFVPHNTHVWETNVVKG